jgi:hypothetical protein
MLQAAQLTFLLALSTVPINVAELTHSPPAELRVFRDVVLTIIRLDIQNALPLQAVELFPDDTIATACRTFESFPIQYLHTSTIVLDQSGFPQHPCGKGDGRAADAEHLREDLLR